MNSTMVYTITGEEGIKRMKENLYQAKQHVKYYWIAICTTLVACFAWRMLVALESHIWRKMIRSDEGKSGGGYDLEARRTFSASASTPGWSSGSGVVRTRFVRPALWQRLVRASVAFMRKYFCEVPMPALGISLAETLIVGAYIAYMAFLLIDNTPNIPINKAIPIRIIGMANRAGLLAIASLPFNVLLSNRISLVGWLVGLSYDKLQYLHRWVGRTTLSLAVVHATCKLIQMHTFYEHSFRRFGLGAFVVVLFLLLWTNRLMRKNFYEVFVAGHIAAVIVLIIMIWNHIPRERKYLIITIALWGTDRAYRWARIFAFNGFWRFGKHRRSVNTAALRLLSHDTTRLEVYKADFSWWKAGAYAYISTPGVPWWPQSHPFTIASRPNRSEMQDKISAPMSTYEIAQHSLDSQKDSAQLTGGKNGSSGGSTKTQKPNLIFLIRARSGWTRELHEMAKRSINPTVPVIVDGPYDGTPEIHKHFDTVILFAGGAGISWTLPILTDLIDRARRRQSSVRRITWVCVMRHYVNYDWFFNELDTIVKQSGMSLLDVRIHYTTNASETDIVPTFFRPGRPDIGELIGEAVSTSQGRTFIGVAGPHGPSEEVRRYARMMTSPMAILRGNPQGDVMFFSEQFGW